MNSLSTRIHMTRARSQTDGSIVSQHATNIHAENQKPAKAGQCLIFVLAMSKKRGHVLNGFWIRPTAQPSR